MDHSDILPPNAASARPPLPVDDELLMRYLAGAISPAERALVEQSLRASPALTAFVAELRTVQASEYRSGTSSLSRGRELLAARLGFAPNHLSLDASDTPTHEPSHTPSPVANGAPVVTPRETAVAFDAASLARKAPRIPMTRTDEASGWSGAAALHRWVGLAAAAAIFVAGGMLMRAVGGRHGALASTTYATGPGQRATVTLADGSHVTLAPDSRLTVASGFGASSRTVALSGEAYFAVASMTGAPFVVQTGAVTTRVLGTTFDVRRYATDTAVWVGVLSGKVATGGRRTPVTLTAGTVAYVTDTTAVATVAGDLRAQTEWTAGRLVFKDVSVAEMLATVGRWYGYTFHLADSTVATQRVAVTFNMDQREETLALIQDLLSVTMKFDGTTVTLSRPHERHSAAPPVRKDATFSPSREVGR